MPITQQIGAGKATKNVEIYTKQEVDKLFLAQSRLTERANSIGGGSGSSEWSNINGRPFNTVNTSAGQLVINGTELELPQGLGTGSNPTFSDLTLDSITVQGVNIFPDDDPQQLGIGDNPTFNNLTLNGTLGVTGLATLDGGFDSNGTSSATNLNMSGNLTVDGTSTFADNILLQTSSNVFFQMNLNIAGGGGIKMEALDTGNFVMTPVESGNLLSSVDLAYNHGTGDWEIDGNRILISGDAQTISYNSTNNGISLSDGGGTITLTRFQDSISFEDVMTFTERVGMKGTFEQLRLYIGGSDDDYVSYQGLDVVVHDESAGIGADSDVYSISLSTGKVDFATIPSANGSDLLIGTDLDPFTENDILETITKRWIFDVGLDTNAYIDVMGDGRIQGDGTGSIEVLADDGTNTGILRVDRMIVNDLEVQGDIDSTNTNELKVEDQFIVVNSGQTGTPSFDGGIYAERGTSSDAYWFWDEGNDQWGQKLGSGGTFDRAIFASEIFPDADGQALGTGDDVDFNSLDINGSTFVDSSRNVTAGKSLSITSAGFTDVERIDLVHSNTGGTAVTSSILFDWSGSIPVNESRNFHGVWYISARSSFANHFFLNDDGEVYGGFVDTSYSLSSSEVSASGKFLIGDSIEIGNTLTINSQLLFDLGQEQNLGENQTPIFAGQIINGTPVTTDGGFNDSGDLTFRAYYDSDATAGVTSSAYDAIIRHTLLSDTPNGRIEFLFGGTSVAWIDDDGDMDLDGTLTADTVSVATLIEGGFNVLTTNSVIDDLDDVVVTGVADNHVLVYDGVTDNRWENRLLAFSDLSGNIANSQVPESAVTQHESALEINVSNQTVGTLPTTRGGTGASVIATARSNLGLEIGVDVQAYSANLDTYAANPLTSAELTELGNINTTAINSTTWERLGDIDQDLSSSSGTPTFQQLFLVTPLSVSGGGTNASTASGARSNLGLAIGTDVQAYSSTLDDYIANPLTASELQQLQNIGANTIGGTQWSYLASQDQNVSTNSSPSWNEIISLDTPLAIGNGGTGATTASNARSNLGLGSFAVLDNDGTEDLSANQVTVGGGLTMNSSIFAGTASTYDIGAAATPFDWIYGEVGSFATSVLIAGNSAWHDGDAPNIGDLDNVVISSPATDEVLQYNGTNWVNAVVSGGLWTDDGDGSISYTGDVDISGNLTAVGGTFSGDVLVGQSTSQRTSAFAVAHNQPDNSAEFGSGGEAMFIAHNGWGSSAMIGWNLYHNDTGNNNIFNHLYYNVGAGGNSTAGVAIGVNNNGAGGFYVYTAPASTGAGTLAPVVERLNIPHSGDITLTPASDLRVNGGLDVTGAGDFGGNLTAVGGTFSGITKIETGASGETGGFHSNSIFRLENSDDAFIEFETPNTSYAGIEFTDNTPRAGGIVYAHNGTTENNELGIGGWTAISFRVSADSGTFNKTERARINSTGLGIGTTSPDNALHVLANSNFPFRVQRSGNNGPVGIVFLDNDANTQEGYLEYDHRNANNAGGYGAAFFLSSTETLGFYIDGDTIADDFTATSDARIKSNETPINNALESIRGITPYHFDKKGQRKVGYIAQNVEQFTENVVSKGERNGYTDFRTMNLFGMQAYNTQAIKEVDSEVTQLKNRVDELEQQVKELGGTL